MRTSDTLPYLLKLRARERPENPLVTCIVPTYNEAENIVPMLNVLHDVLNVSGYRHSILVVDDGSSDGTVEQVLKHAQGLPVTLIQLSRNFGKELALTAGLDHANGDVVVLIDGDFQHPPEKIVDFLQEWAKGYDMVYSVRVSRQGETWIKRMLTHGFYKIANLGSRYKIPADTQDFRVMDRCLVEALRQMPERNRFMKGLYHWVGFTQKAIPTETQPRRAGISSFNYFRLLDLGLTGVTAFSNMPLRIWAAIGSVISLCSVLYALYEMINTLLYGNPVSGWPTLVVAVTFLGGVQLFSIGILGEYLGRVMDEVKQRPPYLVSCIRHLNAPNAGSADDSRTK